MESSPGSGGPLSISRRPRSPTERARPGSSLAIDASKAPRSQAVPRVPPAPTALGQGASNSYNFHVVYLIRRARPFWYTTELHDHVCSLAGVQVAGTVTAPAST